MHPALSIIVFTVTTGLGYGWLALAIVLDRTGFAVFQSQSALLWSAGVGVTLIVIGLLCSTFHLANPRNAWRSFMRVRTSWLSREAVLAIAFFPVFAGYVVCVLAQRGIAASVLGWMSAAIALATVFATGMIYACLRTIRQWHTPLVPANYVLMGLALGGLCLYLQRELGESGSGAQVTGVVFGLLMLALAGKVAYWLKLGLPQESTINAATGFRIATVRLLDVGHTAGTFLTDEFGYQVSRPVLVLLKAVALGLGLVLPAFLVAEEPGVVVASIAVLLAYLGALVERWLFFAEAQHVVRLYHGQAAV